MRVLTYNIHGWRGTDGKVDVDRLVRVIESTQADVVALNEVFHPLIPPGQEQPALDRLATALGMTYAFGVALTPQFAFAPLASYGNALLTRYELLAHAGHHLTDVAGHEQRGLLEARLMLPGTGTPWSFYVTHLDHLSEAVRMKQLGAVFQWTGRDRLRPHLLMGDFNALAPVDYEAHLGDLEAQRAREGVANLVADGMQVVPSLLRRGYVDAGATGAAAQPTFPNPDPVVRIDYIWMSEPAVSALQWCDRWYSEDAVRASDHLPVLAEFHL